LGIASTLILVRLLEPDDFGIAAIAILMVGFAEVLTQTGGQLYILRADSPSRDVIDTAFTLNLLLRTSAMLVLLVLTPGIAHWTGTDEARPALAIATLSLVLPAMKSPRIPILQRQFAFARLSILDVLVKLLTLPISIGLALHWRNYWALILAPLAAQVLQVIGSYWVAPHRPRFSLRNTRHQLSYTRGQILLSITGYARSKIDIGVVSALFGASATGLYKVVEDFVFLVSREMLTPLSTAMLSGLAEQRHNPEQFQKLLSQYASLGWALLIPASTGFSLIATDFTSVVLGKSWLNAAPIIALLAFLPIACFSKTLINQSANILGNFRPAIAIDLLIAVTIMLVGFALQNSHMNDAKLEAFAGFRLMIGIVTILLCSAVLLTSQQLKPRHLGVAFTIPLISTSLMVCALLMSAPWVGELSASLRLAANINIGILAYTTSYLLLLSQLKHHHRIWREQANQLRHILIRLKVRKSI
jgi:O-antigen/teichoic acid export membrane protein